MLDPNQFRFFLDSGAFSAWTQGKAIDLDEYIEFIRANIDQLEAYAVLDVIPGKIGRVATESEREAAADQTWSNYLRMRAAGLEPVPVYHYGEHERHLERMLAAGCDYIGLGGLVGVEPPAQQRWLDRVFGRIVDAQGWPVVKTHGFGVTLLPLIFRYPWHSVDSTAWIKWTFNAKLFVPMRVDGVWRFDRLPVSVFVKEHQTWAPMLRQTVDDWLAGADLTLEQCLDIDRNLAAANAYFFKRVMELARPTPFRLDRPTTEDLL